MTQGSCLCGAVTYEVSGPFQGFFLCHCTRCQKGSGSAHAANLFAPGGQVTWLSGADGLRRYEVKGSRHARQFCGTCGAPMPMMQGDLLVVPAGSLDSPAPISPMAHISTASRATWDADLQGLTSFDGLPG